MMDNIIKKDSVEIWNSSKVEYGCTNHTSTGKTEKGCLHCNS